jgi:hypothetical protein
MSRRRKQQVLDVEAQQVLNDEDRRLAAIADAHAAAETAGRIAWLCAEWAMRSGAGEDDAAEAVKAAVRARQAADVAEHAKFDDAWQAARLAWAAVSTVNEADERVKAAIVESLIRAA